MNIYQRLNEVRKQVSYLQKDSKVQGYKAITHDMVTSAIRPYLIENGIIVVPHQIKGELKETKKTTSNGTPFTVYDAFYEIDFVNMDDPQDKVTVQVGSLAEDNNDKGPGKAISYATKYAMLKILSIETGESDESRIEQKPSYITEEQEATICALAEEVGADYEKFLSFLKVKNTSKILEKDYAKVIALLEKKRANN